MKANGANFPTPEDTRATADMAWRSVSNITAGLLLYGGIGWLLGRKFGHQDAFMAAGLIFGNCSSALPHLRTRFGNGSKHHYE